MQVHARPGAEATTAADADPDSDEAPPRLFLSRYAQTREHGPSLPGRRKDPRVAVVTVAGPIVRAREFLPQLATPRNPRRIPAVGALFLIAGGLVKKVLIADTLAVQVVDHDIPAVVVPVEW